tara:strand:+ start:87 stop:335 length:249 start_codon:yes stop_codon:yes gene_type:complete
MADGYNGWTNYETWNVALWIDNDEGLYSLSRRCRDYNEFSTGLVELLDLTGNYNRTPDGVSWDHPDLNTDELDDLIQENGGE